MADTPGSFGSYIDKSILGQIKIRQDIQDQDQNGQIYSNSFKAIYHNAPWICLRSNVDAPSLKDSKANPTPDASKQYVLCGGTLEYSDTGFKFSGYKGSSDVRDREIPGYTRDSIMGYRPKPGITKMMVKTKDTFGCIMEASIDFTVYSIEDLELIDQVYFKPGMSTLLEWGHSTWTDNSGTTQFMTPGKLLSAETWLGSKTFTELETELQNHRLEIQQGESKGKHRFCGNYEAMLGYITNFSYIFNKNGSYACNLKVMSKGTLLEGFKVPSNAGCSVAETVTESSSRKNGKKEETGRKSKSPFHYIFETALEQIADEVDNEAKKLVRCQDIVRTWPDRTVTHTRIWGKKIIHKDGWWIFGSNDKRPIGFTTLGDFLEITNAVIRNQTGLPEIKFQIPWTPDRSEDKGTISNLNYTRQPYVSFKEHFSLDPGKALVPVPTLTSHPDFAKAEAYGISMANVTGQVSSLGLAPGSVTNIIDDPEINSRSLDTGDNVILDIFVNIEYVLGCLDGLIDTEDDKYSMKEFITSILGGIQKAMGNISAFGMHIDPVTDEIVIVDRNCIASGESDISNVDQDMPIIVSGLKTTVTDLKITSEVSSETANEMAITATTPEDGLGKSEGNANVVFWNEGCKDRHVAKEEKKPDEMTRDQQIQNQYLELLEEHPLLWDLRFLTEVRALYENFSEKKAEEEAATQGFGEYTASRFSNLQLSGETLFKRCINRDIQNAVAEGAEVKTSSYFQAGIIPVKISFTMRGIGRFLIGTTFKVSEGLLPRKYKDWRNIITGVEHNIDNKGWYTTVSSMYYPVLAKVVRPTGSGTPKKPNTFIPGNLIAPDTLPLGTSLEQPKTAVERFFRYFWQNNVSMNGMCAGYVHRMAQSWKSGQLIQGGESWGHAGYVNPKTNMSYFAECAMKAGWTLDPVCAKKSTVDISLSKVKQLIQTVAITPGDIVIYYWKGEQVKQNGFIYYRYAYTDNNGNQKESYQHVQMKMPNKELILGKGGYVNKYRYKPGEPVKVTSGWTTSTFNNYGTSFTYSKRTPDKWDVWILHAPTINTAWAKAKV